jgi:hypothetical protein
MATVALMGWQKDSDTEVNSVGTVQNKLFVLYGSAEKNAQHLAVTVTMKTTDQMCVCVGPNIASHVSIVNKNPSSWRCVWAVKAFSLERVA